MDIKREDILHLADLSNFSLSEKEIESLQKDLQGIIKYISQLDELDTDNIEPTYQVFEMKNVWREDEILPQEASREDLLALTKEEQDKSIFFRASLFMRTMSSDIPLDITTMQIDGITLDDIMFFDERVMAPVNEYNPPVPIMNYAWSKQYGLVQYTFQDGTVFNRIDLK